MAQFHKILSTSVLVLAAVGLNSCRFGSLELQQKMIAYVYQGGHINKRVSFTQGQQHPKEIQDWIQFNNSKLYHLTLAEYVPHIVLICPGIDVTFYSNSVQMGTFIRSVTEEDKQFVEWLMNQPSDAMCPKCKGAQTILNSTYDKWEVCSHCNGSGHIYTY